MKGEIERDWEKLAKELEEALTEESESNLRAMDLCGDWRLMDMLVVNDG